MSTYAQGCQRKVEQLKKERLLEVKEELVKKRGELEEELSQRKDKVVSVRPMSRSETRNYRFAQRRSPKFERLMNNSKKIFKLGVSNLRPKRKP